MTEKKYRRLYGVLFALAGLGLAAFLVLTALNENLSYFHAPTEILTQNPPVVREGRSFRLGGLVEQGSVQRDGMVTRFRVTDMQNSIAVTYDGIVPDLFREGQGVIAEGKMGTDKIFVAQKLLAKHDENYMPPEVAKALKESGQWKEFRKDQ